jgi:hypothetical protein
LRHFAAVRYVYSAFDVTRRYDVVLTSYFSFVPFWGWRQITVLLVAWTHGCLGVHYWLRARSNYFKASDIERFVAISASGDEKKVRRHIVELDAHRDALREAHPAEGRIDERQQVAAG